MTGITNESKINSFYTLHKDKINQILKLFIVLVFAISEWIFKHQFYSIIIIGVFLVFLLLKKRSPYNILVPIILIVIALNSMAVDGLIFLRQTNVNVVKHPEVNLINLLQPNSGLEVLPESVQFMLYMLQNKKIDNFYLSPDILNNEEIKQRIVEAAWPIKMEENSLYIFTSVKETDLYNNCSFIDNSKDITLVYCN